MADVGLCDLGQSEALVEEVLIRYLEELICLYCNREPIWADDLPDSSAFLESDDNEGLTELLLLISCFPIGPFVENVPLHEPLK